MLNRLGVWFRINLPFTAFKPGVWRVSRYLVLMVECRQGILRPLSFCQISRRISLTAATDGVLVPHRSESV